MLTHQNHTANNNLAIDQTSYSYLNIKILFTALVCLAGTRFMSYQLIPDKIYDVLELFVAAVLLGTILLVPNKQGWKNISFKYHVLFFALLAVLNSFTAALLHDQPILYSLSINRTLLFWLFYYFLHYMNIPVQKLISILVGLGVAWCAINIVQQFTFPNYFFYTRGSDGEDNFFRGGVYRFGIDTFYYGLFLILYFYRKFTKTFNYYFLLPVILGLASFYFTGTRQFLISAVLVLVLMSVLQKGKIKLYLLLIVTLCAAILISYKDVLFGDLIAMTTDQLSSKDDIRVLAAKFFLFDYWPNSWGFIIGNGMEHANSSYGEEMAHINNNLGYFKSDVGIIGGLNTYGLLYVVCILSLLYKVFTKRLIGDAVTVKYCFVTVLLLIATIESFSTPSAIPFFCILLYIFDKNISGTVNTSPKGISH